jgi:hypothetical protein
MIPIQVTGTARRDGSSNCTLKFLLSLKKLLKLLLLNSLLLLNPV